MFKRVETKCLLEYLLRHLHYFSIFRELINCKLDLFASIKLYGKSFNTKIKELNIFVNKTNNKLVNSYCLLKQQLELEFF